MPHEVLIKGILCLVAIPIVLWRDRAGHPHSPRKAGALLMLLATVAVATYYNYGAFHGRGYVHYWEQFHYYLGSKYFPEVGYDGLYAASLAAQRETQPEMEVQPWVRDLETNQVVSSYGVLARASEARTRFTPERWRSFTDDHDHFLRHMAWGYLSEVRKDHGYNPSPTWTFVARLFDVWLPAGSDTQALLGALDPLLLLALFGFLVSTYGSRVGCLCLVVFGLGYPWRFDWIGGAFLRLDWLVALGVAVCLMRRERYRWAGALVAYAAMVRIFPAVFLLGPAVLAVRALVHKEDLCWVWRFAQGFLVSALLCLAAGALTGRGIDAWGEFARNLGKHQGTWLTNNVGLENVVLYDLDTVTRKDVDWSLPEPWLRWQHKMDRLHDERRAGIYALALLYLGLVVAAAWRAERDEGLVLGIAAVFALALLTCYYWAMLLLVPIRSDKLGAAVLLALSAVLCGVHLATPPSFEMVYGVMSWALALLAWVWLGPGAWATLREGWTQLRRPRPVDAG